MNEFWIILAALFAIGFIIATARCMWLSYKLEECKIKNDYAYELINQHLQTIKYQEQRKEKEKQLISLTRLCDRPFGLHECDSCVRNPRNTKPGEDTQWMIPMVGEDNKCRHWKGYNRESVKESIK